MPRRGSIHGAPCASRRPCCGRLPFLAFCRGGGGGISRAFFLVSGFLSLPTISFFHRPARGGGRDRSRHAPQPWVGFSHIRVGFDARTHFGWNRPNLARIRPMFRLVPRRLDMFGPQRTSAEETWPERSSEKRGVGGHEVIRELFGEDRPLILSAHGGAAKTFLSGRFRGG